MRRKKNIVSTTTFTNTVTSADKLEVMFKEFESVMKEQGYSWYGEDGLLLAPFELFKMFDAVCEAEITRREGGL